VDPIRILLLAMPRLMRDIVEAELLAQPDILVLDAPDSATALEVAIRRGEPDFVLTGVEHTFSVSSLFDERPWMRVVELEAEAAHGHLYELRPCRLDLGPVSAPQLVDTIRAAAAAPRWRGECV
jgi:hypothetical protein